jgi:hypothetical protein
MYEAKPTIEAHKQKQMTNMGDGHQSNAERNLKVEQKL